MDAAGIASFLVASQAQNTRLAVATAAIKQEQKQTTRCSASSAKASSAAPTSRPPRRKAWAFRST